MPSPVLPQSFRSASFDMEPTPPPLADAEIDTLPPYTNNIRLATLCYRKREFRAAFDKVPRGFRTWEPVWLVLNGTALRVYKAEREERCAIDGTDMPLLRTGSRVPTRCSGSPANPRPTGTRLEGTPAPRIPRHGGLSHSSIYMTMLSSSSSYTSLPAPRQEHRGSFLKVAPAPALPPPYTATPFSASTPFLIRSTSTTPTSSTPDFSKRKFLRQYPLQYAICTRADAYTKREHVLRFILHDGKQFLVQLSNRSETVAWLQLMSIAAPLSLDLDERPMPEPAHYPRRRPRPRDSQRPSTAPGALETASASASAMASNEGRPREGVEEEVEDGQEMDHLPPPRRPEMMRSLSSVEQARRLGIQI